MGHRSFLSHQGLHSPDHPEATSVRLSEREGHEGFVLVCRRRSGQDREVEAEGTTRLPMLITKIPETAFPP